MNCFLLYLKCIAKKNHRAIITSPPSPFYQYKYERPGSSFTRAIIFLSLKNNIYLLLPNTHSRVFYVLVHLP